MNDLLGTGTRASAPKILCLCGSGRFRESFEAASRWLTLEGHVVITSINETPEAAGEDLDPLVRQKIEMSHELVVLNLHGYIDDQTRAQIVLAQRLGKTVDFLVSADWNAPVRGVRHAPRQQQPRCLEGMEAQRLEEGAVLDLTEPFVVLSGAVLLYGPDETRPAFTLVSNHVWPGVRWVPEVWYAEAASNTSVKPFEAEDSSLQPVGELIRWAVATSGQISERMLWALLVVGSVTTQDELSAIIGCRRESVTSAMRELREQGLIEKSQGRIRLTEKGVVCASKLCDFDDEDAFDTATDEAPETETEYAALFENNAELSASRFA